MVTGSLDAGAGDVHAAYEWLISTASAVEPGPMVREAYERVRGKVFEDEALWETWCQLYLEWYVFQWRYEGQAPRAVAFVHQAPAELQVAATAWCTSQRTLCEFMAVGGSARIRDVLRGATFEVATAIPLAGVEPGDIAEVRLVGYEGRVWFGPTMLFHERAAREVIARQCQQAQAAGTSPDHIMDALAQLRAKVGRYSHMPAHKIYALDQALSERSA